ncbi:MAG: TerC family protein [Actinobacteria bacterium]|nr:TerC family protein [Actinomycetota bacterium]
MAESAWWWVAFNAGVLGLLALDLGVFHRKAYAPSLREAGLWSAVWIALALGFNAWIWLAVGAEPGAQFLTGYLVEKSLSVDNIFVFALIFSTFGVPAAYQHRVLFWGIVGALVMRGILIAAGAYLIETFHWIVYVFGALLVATGVRLAARQEHAQDLNRTLLVRLIRRVIPVTSDFHGSNFWARVQGRLLATPLLVVLLVVEASDLLFAVDSIPAIFAITSDPFLVYTSNVFAILGLRALYFLLAGVIDKFRYLKVALAAILVFVGGKMLLSEVVHVAPAVSLGAIAAILAFGMALSLRRPAGSAGRETAMADDRS